MLQWNTMYNSVWTYVYTCLEYMPRGRIAGSHGGSLFSFLKNCQTVFESNCTILQSREQDMRVLIFQPPCHHSLSVFLILAVLVGVKWYLIMGLICISMANFLFGGAHFVDLNKCRMTCIHHCSIFTENFSPPYKSSVLCLFFLSSQFHLSRSQTIRSLFRLPSFTQLYAFQVLSYLFMTW